MLMGFKPSWFYRNHPKTTYRFLKSLYFFKVIADWLHTMLATVLFSSMYTQTLPQYKYGFIPTEGDWPFPDFWMLGANSEIQWYSVDTRLIIFRNSWKDSEFNCIYPFMLMQPKNMIWFGKFIKEIRFHKWFLKTDTIINIFIYAFYKYTYYFPRRLQ